MTTTQLSVHDHAVYRIRLQGVLEESWRDSISDMQIIKYQKVGSSESPETLLLGTVQDQAALAGVLTLVYNLGLPLLAVECLGRRVDSD